MAASLRPMVICLTPVKNEAWILERFLSCASLWADHIILADQGSTDQTRQIAARFPKVRVIDNPAREYGEGERQKLLLEAARAISDGGRGRLLLALDADEFFTADSLASSEWDTMLRSPPGTVFSFHWINVEPGFRVAWDSSLEFAWGFMDDGSPHEGRPIHSVRVPTPAGSPRVSLRDVRVLHYQFTDWRRMESKNRYYQMWERTHRPTRPSASIFRQYHYMYAVPEAQKVEFAPLWIAGYEARGIEMTNVPAAETYWYDRECLAWLMQWGPEYFAELNIWGVDWNDLYGRIHGGRPLRALDDPRSLEQQADQRWLMETQAGAEAPAVMRRQRTMEVREIAGLLERHEKNLPVPAKVVGQNCRLCGGAEVVEYLRQPGWRILVCGSCGNGWTDPPPARVDYAQGDFHALTVSEMGGAGGGRPVLGDLPPAWQQSVTMQAELLALSAGGRVLEIGCGQGILLEQLVKRGLDAVGLEVSAAAGEAARRAGLKVVTGTLPQEEIDGPFEVVVMSQVLEHLADPAAMLGEIGEVAATGGRLLLVQTNYRGWMPRWYRERWYAWVPEQHFWHFTPQGLERLLRRFGWEVERVEYSSLVHTSSHNADLALDLPGMGDQFHLLARRAGRGVS